MSSTLSIGIIDLFPGGTFPMKETIQKNKSSGGINNTIKTLQKKIFALEKENAKLTDKNMKQYAELCTHRNTILSLKKLIPDTRIPKTLEEKLRELDKK